MWLGRLFFLAILAAVCTIAATDLEKQDLRSVEQAFRKKEPALNRFDAVAKKSIDATRAVLIVEAEQTEERTTPAPPSPVGPQCDPKFCSVPGTKRMGVFVVAGRTNRVLLVVDIYSDQNKPVPVISQPGVHSVNLHYYDDYGMYEESTKYFYDLASGKPPLKFRYGRLELTTSKVRNGRVVYSGFSLNRAMQLEIDPRSGDAVPGYKITALPTGKPYFVSEPASLRLPDGQLLEQSYTPPGQPHQVSGFFLKRKSGARAFYPVPVPTMALYRKMRPKDQKPSEIENDIGPIAQQGSTIWFANSFYDGESVSGVGAVGSFDIATHKFEMRYLPQIVAWSGSAMRLDTDDLWIGLMRQPEGEAYSGGLLRYNIRTGAVEKYDVADYIYTIDRVGDTIYCGTSNGIYGVRGDRVTHMRFEPDATGKTTMVAERR